MPKHRISKYSLTYFNYIPTTFQATSAIVAILGICGSTHCVRQYVCHDVSEQHAAYIFRGTERCSGYVLPHNHFRV